MTDDRDRWHERQTDADAIGALHHLEGKARFLHGAMTPHSERHLATVPDDLRSIDPDTAFVAIGDHAPERHQRIRWVGQLPDRRSACRGLVDSHFGAPFGGAGFGITAAFAISACVFMASCWRVCSRFCCVWSAWMAA